MAGRLTPAHERNANPACVCGRQAAPLWSAAAGLGPGAGSGSELGFHVADDIFSEVDDDLRAEQSRARVRRLATAGLAGLATLAVGIGGWQYVAHRQNALANAVAPAYFAAQADADTAPLAAAGPDAPLTPQQRRAIVEFGQVAATAPEGFATLARLRLAALDWEGHDRAGALALWDRIAGDRAADPDFRGLADLLWVQHQADDADPAILKTRLRDILVPTSPWRLMAQEADALIDLHANRIADARRKLAALSQDAAASEGQRERAGGLLDTLDSAKTGG